MCLSNFYLNLAAHLFYVTHNKYTLIHTSSKAVDGLREHLTTLNDSNIKHFTQEPFKSKQFETEPDRSEEMQSHHAEPLVKTRTPTSL